ncbi:hypothetical protein B0H13DRAFT_1033132 [Mycena leptocephala]|nr:hypothetical protein B0H13DRAFT_1033132 [Mycena leptocephala]
MTTSADLPSCVCAYRTQRWCGLDAHGSRADEVGSFAWSRGRRAPICGTGRSRGWKWGGWNWMAHARMSIRSRTDTRVCGGEYEGRGASAAGGPSTVTLMRRARLLHLQRPRVVHLECARRQRGTTQGPWRFRCTWAEGQGPKRVRRCYGVDVPAGGWVRVGPPALRPSSRSARSAPWRRGGSVRQDEGGAGDGKGEACASGRCRTTSGWRCGRVREGSRMKREGLCSVGATTQAIARRGRSA